MKLVTNDSLNKRFYSNKICLLDADRIKHVTYSRAMHSIEKEFIEDVSTMKKVIRAEAMGMVEDFESKIGDPIIYCFSGKSYNTFRYKVGFQKEYKGSRKEQKLSIEEIKLKAELMNEAMTSIINEKVCLIFDDLEADDILSMLQSEHTYIFSNDKDLKQIPGFHFDIEKGCIYEITQDEAVRNLALQLLTGDSTDDIAGINGIGPVKAKKILEEVSPKNMISRVFKIYREKYGIINGTDMFCENWLLVKLRSSREGFFDQKYISAYSLVENIKNKFLNLNP